MWQNGAGLGEWPDRRISFLQFNSGQAPYAETRYATEVQAAVMACWISSLRRAGNDLR